ncbi:Hypothetical protein CINCED_3A006058 [Cinara cedri]|uniref:Uncharacterized protein n=1 Tax=Cinara cedri TaxID=506608 RepID=A0A5E4MUG1_9HEMI|nr:Hypothetical protein CINCED_3A006058 [Cinara cedri]
METLAWHFLISSLFSLLAKHSCQVLHDHHNTEPLNPIILLPASSGISYEALHYPMPVEQYQLLPLVINTGKIPLINHPVQAPIQYFIPNRENRQISNYDSTTRHEYRSTTQNSPKTPYSNAQNTNQPKYKYNLPTTIYSEKHVEGQPELRYSYGYKIIDGDIGDSNGQRELGENGNIISESYNSLEESADRSKNVFQSTDNPKSNFRAVVRNQKLDNADRDDKLDLLKALKPIIVRPDVTTIQTELKKHYKNTTSLGTPNNVANHNRNLTTFQP